MSYTEPSIGNPCYGYDPCKAYCPPKGRLPVLGKVRADIDRIRIAIADTVNQIKNRDDEQEDSHYKIHEELNNLRTKTTAEVTLLKQKAVTELSQTSDYIPHNAGMNNTTTVQGIVDKQKGLFQKQTDSFDRDAEQKLAKIMVDTWTVRQTTDGEVSSTAGVDNAEINRVLSKAKSGIDY
jgi:hypothetical protein